MHRTSIVESLLARAIAYVESKKPEFLRATTPAIHPYVEAYRKFGFKPLRRDFRIVWKVDDMPDIGDIGLETQEVSDETIDHASNFYVRALSPYWDWRTEEESGIGTVANVIKEDRSRGARWFLSSSDKEPAGLVGIIPDYYESGVAWFRGAFVVPEHRGKGIGSALMSEISRIAKNLGQSKTVVYTFSYLDSLAPGALLYLRTGGKDRSRIPPTRQNVTFVSSRKMMQIHSGPRCWVDNSFRYLCCKSTRDKLCLLGQSSIELVTTG
jgi:GNAT superfamily N-acetyltransferase